MKDHIFEESKGVTKKKKNQRSLKIKQ